MNRIIQFLLISLVLVAWACTPTEKSAENEETTTSEAQPTSPNIPSETGASNLFAIKVLKGDIPSPMKQLTSTVDGAEVTITYGSPSVKGRTVWGDLVPYAEVWRTGANEATTFEVSKDIEISGQKLPAGKYGFFSIPDENDWTLVFNETADQWGAYEYDSKKDVMRVKVIPQDSGEMSETMEFKVIEGNTVVLLWDKLMVPFKISVAS